MKIYFGFVVIFAALLLSEKVSCQKLRVGDLCSTGTDCLSTHCDGGQCSLGQPGDPCETKNDCVFGPATACV
ncbi:7900_t:CDS:2, partial [Dentiscutata heterogama]